MHQELEWGGGVWFPASNALRPRLLPGNSTAESSVTPGPILWRATFPNEISKNLVSQKNPKGQLTNSDLELAAGIIQHDVAAHNFDICEKTIASGSDNTPTLAWQAKGSTTTTTAPAYLLRLQAIHQPFHQYNSSPSFFVPGKLNAMADDCSRLWHLDDSQLLEHFNRTYPQAASWRIAQPRQEMLSSVICALHRQQPEPASFLRKPPPTTTRGPSGPSSVNSLLWTPGLATTLTPFYSYRSLPSATAQAKFPPAANLCDRAQWKAPYVPWVRPLQDWGPRTLD
jgi:hypothetical protein